MQPRDHPQALTGQVGSTAVQVATQRRVSLESKVDVVGDFFCSHPNRRRLGEGPGVQIPLAKVARIWLAEVGEGEVVAAGNAADDVTGSTGIATADEFTLQIEDLYTCRIEEKTGLRVDYRTGDESRPRQGSVNSGRKVAGSQRLVRY